MMQAQAEINRTRESQPTDTRQAIVPEKWLVATR